MKVRLDNMTSDSAILDADWHVKNRKKVGILTGGWRRTMIGITAILIVVVMRDLRGLQLFDLEDGEPCNENIE
jgi:hypothetical protein